MPCSSDPAANECSPGVLPPCDGHKNHTIAHGAEDRPCQARDGRPRGIDSDKEDQQRRHHSSSGHERHSTRIVYGNAIETWQEGRPRMTCQTHDAPQAGKRILDPPLSARTPTATVSGELGYGRRSCSLSANIVHGFEFAEQRPDGLLCSRRLDQHSRVERSISCIRVRTRESCSAR